MDAGKEVRSPRKEGARRDSVGWRETRRQTSPDGGAEDYINTLQNDLFCMLQNSFVILRESQGSKLHMPTCTRTWTTGKQVRRISCLRNVIPSFKHKTVIFMNRLLRLYFGDLPDDEFILTSVCPCH